MPILVSGGRTFCTFPLAAVGDARWRTAPSKNGKIEDGECLKLRIPCGRSVKKVSCVTLTINPASRQLQTMGNIANDTSDFHPVTEHQRNP